MIALTRKIKIIVSALVLTASISTYSVFAHEGSGEGHGMMSGGMGGMMQMMSMMSQMSPEERQSMTKACMNMMQSQADAEAGAEAKE